MGLTGTTTPAESEAGNNGNEKGLHTLQISRTGASPPEAVWCHIQDMAFDRIAIEEPDKKNDD